MSSIDIVVSWAISYIESSIFVLRLIRSLRLCPSQQPMLPLSERYAQLKLPGDSDEHPFLQSSFFDSGIAYTGQKKHSVIVVDIDLM